MCDRLALAGDERCDMIKRVVLIKLNEEYANEAGRDKVVRHAQRVLPLLPGVVGVQVGSVAEGSSPDWDVTIIVELAHLEDYARYRDDPDHRAFLDEFLKPRTVTRTAANFVIEDLGEN